MRTPARQPVRAHNERRQAALMAAVSQQVRQALFASVLVGADEEAASKDRSALTIPRALASIGPAQLAARHPGGGEARQQARALYERCLAHYRNVLRAADAALGADDVGAAVAAFVAANVEALHGVQATPEMLLRLEYQLGGVVRSSSGWDTADAYERQAYFEQMAVIAVLVSEASKQAAAQGPAAVANLKRAARGYLTELLGLEPDALTLDATGLVLRAPAAAAGNVSATPTA